MEQIGQRLDILKTKLFQDVTELDHLTEKERKHV